MQTAVVEDTGIVLSSGKKITVAEARRILRMLRAKKNACNGKLIKVANRVKLLERFINETRGKKTTLATWMKGKGLDYKDFYKSMGYYTPLQMVVSDDAENEILVYHRDMSFNDKAGFHVPNRRKVEPSYHSAVLKSQLGMTYDPSLALYFPTTIYDTDLYAKSEEVGDSAVDIMGGFTRKDIGNLSAYNEDAEEFVETIKELFEEEFDNVQQESDTIILLENDILLADPKSNASGVQSGKNAICRAGCNFKRRKYRAGCWTDCDKKYPASQKQEVRRDDFDERREAREKQRKEKEALKAKMRAGELSRKQYREGKQSSRKTKRSAVKEAGGNFFARIARGVAKVFPLTAGARGGVIILTKGNAFGFATRLAPALLPHDEAKTKFKASAITKSREGWEKVSRAWVKLGGNPDKLRQAILDGYKKKPMKVSRKSSADGRGFNYSYSYDNTAYVDDHSNVVGEVATAIAMGLSALAGLIKVLKSSGVEEDPYKDGMTPTDYQDALNKGIIDDEPSPDPNSPVFDPITGEWTDPSTGRPIDPLTGEFLDDKIFGMNKWLAIGIGVVLVGGIVMIARKAGQGKGK